MPHPRVLITGTGFVTSIGNDRASVTDSLRHARHGIEVFPELPQDVGICGLAGTLKGFSFSGARCEDWTLPPGLVIDRNHLRSMSPHVVCACHAMDQAIAESGLTADQVSHPRTGAMCASGGSMSTVYENLQVMETRGVHRCYPLALPAGIPGTLNSNLAAKYKLKGAVLGFASACASSAHALGYAYDQIMLGRQDIVFVVGAEDCNRTSILPFAAVRALSTRNDPQTVPCPFDAQRDGFVATGGATVLVLESETSAQKRGAKPLAEVLGWGEAADGFNVMAPEPHGEGLGRAMNNALQSAGLDTNGIDYLNAHATGTTVGDTAEIRAIQRVFTTGRLPWISSTKALTGHGLCLAGAMEAAFCVLSLKEGFMPVSAKISRLDPEFEGVPILTKPVDAAPHTAMTNSSGFGGSNVSVILRKWQATA
ncbi:MAG: beta-ketoacyl-[acyl-carrier-protein] synthase family protein [Candidatus Methylacidiphilales bacterium]|nr:beta-ketoacyl-[acyl-carrier-protein] synthase family protein [Candidatus Methylacidiphilales bacterium]